MRARHGNLKIHAVAGHAVGRTPAVGAAFSINFRSRHPFPSKAKGRHVGRPLHNGRGGRQVTFP